MATTENLVAFRDLISGYIGNIPLEDVDTNSDMYRLVKILDWANGALNESSGSSGGTGGTSNGLTQTQLSDELEVIENLLNAYLRPQPGNVNHIQPIDVSYVVGDASEVLVQNVNNDSIRRIVFSVSSPCTIELFRDNVKLAIFLDVQSVDMEFNDWISQGSGISVVITNTVEDIRLTGYALLNNNDFGG